MRKAFVSLIFLAQPALATPSLHVYSLNFSNQGYVNQSPSVIWSATTLAASPQGWVSADQYLVIQTNEPYQQGNWSIQVFTDNTDEAHAPIQTPDYFQNKQFVPGTIQSGPLTPRYHGQQAYQSTPGGPVIVPKSGLISQDGRERLPLIWKIIDPPANKLPSPPQGIEENSDKTTCDFRDCTWAFFLDKGDLKITPGSLPVSNWTDNFWYVVPLNKDGAQYAIFNRFQPSYFGGWTSQILYLASNFRNATRQPYATTLFVELLEI